MLLRVALLAGLIATSSGLNNGLALTPPCGLNSYMSGRSGEAFLQSIADFFVASGMREMCFNFVNSDEGWELPQRNATTHELQWDPNQYPSGMPAFSARLEAQGIHLGLYGAASGVTCGGISGQLGYEDLDMTTISSWGVRYWKSDNCASYAMDSSVRFAATRDAINRTGAPIVLSIEPFSISPDLRQSAKVANLWRVAQDISGNWATLTNRADISDKWAPLAGPGGWNDPDMINVGTQLTLAENRAYFGLWALMKAPLLLSADLPHLNASAPAIIGVVSSPEVVAINQDPLGVQARKLGFDGAVLPWLVGTESCDLAPGGGLTGMRNRGWSAPSDTRVWSLVPSSVPNASLIINSATGRCLSNGTAMGLATAVLLPCNASDPQQGWTFPAGLHTVGAVVNAASGLALALANSTLFTGPHGSDAPGPDAAYGTTLLQLVPYSPQLPCTARDCEGYDPSQLWYVDPSDGFLVHSTYTASINHCFDGGCYELTSRLPTAAHLCLAHVLSVRNAGSDAGTLEVWGGPLAQGRWVLGLLNRGGAAATISAPFALLGAPGVGPATLFCVRDAWARANVGPFTGVFSATVQPHDLGVYVLAPGQCL